jgi:hypothetical protein
MNIPIAVVKTETQDPNPLPNYKYRAYCRYIPWEGGESLCASGMTYDEAKQNLIDKILSRLNGSFQEVALSEVEVFKYPGGEWKVGL